MREKHHGQYAGPSRTPGAGQIFERARVRRSTLGDSVSVGSDSRVDDSNLGDFVRLQRYNHVVACDVGRYTYTGMNTVMMHATVGAFCSIAWGVTVGGGEHDYRRITQHSFLYDEWSKISSSQHEEGTYNRFAPPLVIGSDVWIGATAVVLRGINVGDGAVIGANATVTEDVEPFSIVAGSPAKKIGQRFPDDLIDELVELKWWDWPADKLQAASCVLGSLADTESVAAMRKYLPPKNNSQ